VSLALLLIALFWTTNAGAAPAPLPLPPYSATSFWNTTIPASPAIDPDSAVIVQDSFVAYQANANFSNTPSWGRAIYLAQASDKLYTIVGKNKTVQARIPAGAKPNSGSDHHMVVVEGDVETDMWVAVYDATNDKWSASWVGQTSITGWGAHCALRQHCNGPVAAGFAAAGGQGLPEDFQRGRINHALAITTPRTRSGFIACPATHTDGKFASNTAMPEGARLQLDPAFNVAAQPWAAWQKVLAKALQEYGAYTSDTGGTVSVKGEAADLDKRGLSWASVGVPSGPNLSWLPWTRMRVLLIERC
jgi:hypothetical protein